VQKEITKGSQAKNIDQGNIPSNFKKNNRHVDIAGIAINISKISASLYCFPGFKS